MHSDGKTASQYQRFDGDDLILRDELAIDRTLLANERTLLAYLRSAVSLVIFGVTILHFTGPGWFWALGLFCLPLGVGVGWIGVMRSLSMSEKIWALRAKTGK